MKNELLRWIERELQARNWSIRELARQMGKSHSQVSRAMSGQNDPKIGFYRELAEAFDEPIEKILKLAGWIPDKGDDSELTFRELVESGKHLTPAEREEVLDFVDYLLHRRKKRNDKTD